MARRPSRPSASPAAGASRRPPIDPASARAAIEASIASGFPAPKHLVAAAGADLDVAAPAAEPVATPIEE